MSKIVFLLTFLLVVVIGYPQQNYFVLVQSDNQFFLTGINCKTFYFSGTGNFIKTDTLPKSSADEPAKKDDAFSRLMAGVVNDTAILYNTYIDVVPKKDTLKRETAKKHIVKIDSPVLVSVIPGKKSQADTLKKEAVVIKPDEKKKDSVQIPQHRVYVEKLSEERSESTLYLMYSDIDRGGKKDIINVVIPFETATVITKPQIDTAKKTAETASFEKDTVQGLSKDTAFAAVKQHEKDNAPVVTARAIPDSIKKDTVTVEKKTIPKPSVVNSNCKSLASDYDVDKLRVKMLAINNEDDKILIARKFFRIKCYTTKQVRALSEVFPTDEGRYKLFDTSYPFVSDYGNYAQLSGLLTSQYYINRFNAMLKQ